MTREQRRYALSVFASALVLFGGLYVAAIVLTIGFQR